MYELDQHSIDIYRFINWNKHTPGGSWSSSDSSSLLPELSSSNVSVWFKQSMLTTIFSGGESLGIEASAIGEPLGAVGELLYCSVSPRLKSSSSEGSSEECSELVPVPRCLLFLDNMASRPLSEAVDCRPSAVFNVLFSGDLNFIKKNHHDIWHQTSWYTCYNCKIKTQVLLIFEAAQKIN